LIISVRGFGERLDAGIKLIDERTAGIATKLNDDMVQMRSEANTSRETLRGLIEAKLDHSTHQQGEAAKALRDELGGNFQRWKMFTLAARRERRSGL
jgi:hypothetical protein